MTYIWRGCLYDEPSDSRVIVYFAGWLANGWPNLTSDWGQATVFLSYHQARSLLTETKKAIPWMGVFAVAKHPAVAENGD